MRSVFLFRRIAAKFPCVSDVLDPPQPICPGIEKQWLLDPRIAFLNHGSFGALPRAVFDQQTVWRQRIEAEPIEMLHRSAPQLHAAVKRVVGETVGMAESDFGLVTNATEGVNAVLRSIELRPGDELLTTTHVYNAVRQSMRYVAGRAGATVREIDLPTPITSSEQIERLIVEGISDATRLLIIDHVTSPTALIFPVQSIIAACARRSIDVLIDGAHAPAMLPLKVAALGASYYAGNLHKWACAPRGSAFLWVRPDRQWLIHPLSISHLFGEGFATEFSWQGTRDFSAWLTVPAALEFLGGLGWDRVRDHNHALAVWVQRMLCDRWSVEPLSPLDGRLLGSMCTVRLPPPLDQMSVNEAIQFQRRLYLEEKIEVPVFHWAGAVHARPCCQVYNTASEYQRLAETILRWKDGVAQGT
jgi:isopenicillin-N epimerase